MNTETMKLMSEVMKTLGSFVERQTAFNVTMMDNTLAIAKQNVELNKQVKALTKKMEEDNE